MQVDELCVPRMSVICQVEDDVKEVDPELASAKAEYVVGSTYRYHRLLCC